MDEYPTNGSWGRRNFFKVSAAAVAGALASGCTILSLPGTSGHGPRVHLGKGDIGLMNFALTLEGLEAEFYMRVLQNPYAGMSNDEHHILSDIRDHEIVHREFFRRSLGADAIPPLTYKFSTIDFNNRRSVLMAARTFEDTGVTAYNGAGHLVRDPNILLIAGKIVSVEGRHAAAVRDLLDPLSTAFSPAPLDGSHSPYGVLNTISPYIHERVDGSSLPRA